MYHALIKLAEDEGIAAAVQTAEQWARTFEDIAACGTATERAAVAILLTETHDALKVLQARAIHRAMQQSVTGLRITFDYGQTH